jgi:hypothetical protein
MKKKTVPASHESESKVLTFKFTSRVRLDQLLKDPDGVAEAIAQSCWEHAVGHIYQAVAEAEAEGEFDKAVKE